MFGDVTVTAAVPDAGPSIDERLDIVEALRRIPRRQRAVLVCRYLLDMDVADTAVALGCSEGTVKSQTARALDALRLQAGELAGRGHAIADAAVEGTGR